MISVLFVDIDGVILECPERERRTNEIVEAATQSLKPYLDNKQLESTGKSVFYHKDVFYNHQAMLTDTLIENAQIDLKHLASRYTFTILLTSRPEYTRRTTLESLQMHGIDTTAYSLVPKPPPALYTKTVSWKAGIIDALSMFLHANHVDVVDNEEAIRKEVLSHQDPQRFTLDAYASLAEAVSAQKSL